MEPLCEYCGAQRALVYCRPDAARLCLPCDQHVHSANSLSRRHLRALLCDRCGDQPASVRIPDLKLSLCPPCASQWAPPPPSSGHVSRLPMGFYSGCPTLAELSRILSAGGGCPGPAPGPGAGPGAMDAINENCEGTCWDASVVPELDPWNLTAGVDDDNKDSIVSTLAYPGLKDIGMCDDNGIEGLNPGDVGYNMENIDELFGCAQAKYPFQDAGLDGGFMEKNFSVADSNGNIESAVEASSSVQHDGIPLPSTCSALHAMSNNTDMLSPQANRNINFGFPPGTLCPTMSLTLSNLTGESSVADYQDCGVSPLFLSSESPWDSNLETSRPQARNEAMMRYNEKKKSRLFGKQIRYASRKARADTRKRVKGDFQDAANQS